MRNKKGFTLAEIIISMTIIGVIAAITLPALLVSVNEKTMEAKKKALHARISQSISQIDDLRVYAKKDESGNDHSSSLNFVTTALKKVYRISKACDDSTLIKNCDFPDEIITADGAFRIEENIMLTDYLNNATYAKVSDLGGLDTKVAGFKTTNGESIAIYYNPNCRGSKTNGAYSGSAVTAMCLNMIYDLNGKNEAPNEVGKDVGFATVFFPKDPDISLPIVFSSDVTDTFNNYTTAAKACKAQDKSLILPNWEDGMSMALNKKLANIEDLPYLVTGAGSMDAYKMDTATLIPSVASDFTGLKLRCIYNN